MAKTAPDTETVHASEDQDISQRIAGTTINVETMLATDYLNHFNEVVMLFEMLPDMPECLDELTAWQPKSYQDHFRDSGFSSRDLAVEAYDHAPLKFRAPFETIIGCLDDGLLSAIAEAKAAVAGEVEGQLLEVVVSALPKIQSHLDMASSIINGVLVGLDQSDVDKILES